MIDVRRVPVGTAELEVAAAGEAGRPLLLVHGYGGAKEDFADFLEPLAARGWHAVAPDLRGHGESGKPEDEDAYDWPLFVGDLLALADALGWNSFVLLGHSMGGMIAQHLVLRHPERVRALVLMDTTHGAVDWVDPDSVAAAGAILREQGVEAYVDLTSRMADDPLATPAHLRLLEERDGYKEFCDRKALVAGRDMRLAMMPKLLGQPDRLDDLANVDVPTLVIVGELDQPFLPHAERMAKAIPDARLVVVPDAGHSPQFEAPRAWWAALSAFLDGLR